MEIWLLNIGIAWFHLQGGLAMHCVCTCACACVCVTHHH